ncbi:MAG: CRISPR-associated protein Csx11 [Anaerolineae bacterium]|nr:CRISPR-associated protein Csx11 [Anaerolineae bacterium]
MMAANKTIRERKSVPPLAFERAVGTSLTSNLWGLPWGSLAGYTTTYRQQLLANVDNLFTIVGADTRRPINEINLWDWGLLVGALYKSSVAAVLLGHQPANRDLRWQLLGIRTDALAYLTNVSRLPDLAARQNTLQVAINDVQILLEETYPLATEVYRDENGSLYVVPDVPNLLALQGGGGQPLLTHIEHQFATDGEIVPQVTLDPTAWWGQDPDRQGNDQIPPAGAILSAPMTLQSDASIISETWRSETQQVCPICGLRPCVNKQLDYCQICGDRRKGRVVEWLQDQSKTIWLDEVADSNGRIALIIGTFDLTHWLDGILVQTMLVQGPTAGIPAVTKTPSFARLRRVWRTTQTFWQHNQDHINRTLSDNRRRLLIRLADTSGLTTNQTYELDLRGQTRMRVLWDGSHLISIDNLSYTAIQLGVKGENRKTPEDAALAVGTWLETNKEENFQLISDDEKNKQLGIKIADVDYQDAAYAATIPILAQPRTFMTLVPADKALAVVETIHTKYEREMGKVRNRLPLHLGIVYFQRRTPLRSALDAGRRMLKYKSGMMDDEVWTVKRDAQTGPLPDEKADLAQGTQHFNQTVTVELEQNGRSLTWYVPAVMGDGVTPDNWYPYVFIQSGFSNPQQRLRTFKGLRPTGDNKTKECWLIHAGELKEGDQVYFTPATLDFQWLESAAQRFEIAYDEDGKRRDSFTLPYRLDQLDEINAAWGMLHKLSKSQLYALRDAVEEKRAAWFSDSPAQSLTDETFQRFCRDVVLTTKWPTSLLTAKTKEGKKRLPKDKADQLTAWAINGLLTDTIELHVSIMKEDLQTEEQPNE